MVAHFRADGCPDAGIVIWKFNRFARDIDDAQYYKADLRRRGYKIHSLNDSVPDGLDGRFFEAAIDWMNARYLEDLSVDVRRGLYYIVQQGGIPGIPPRGFLREALQLGTHRDGRPRTVHRWVPDPAMIDAVRTAFQMRAAGSSYAAITKATRIYTNKNSWTHFFANRLYMGELHYGDLVIPGYCEPIVSEELFNAVQAVNQKNIEKGKKMDAETTTNHPRRARSVYLLSGLLKCARCGGAMNGETMKKKGRATMRYYGCSTHRRNGSCDAQLIPQQLLEETVLHEVIDHILDTGNLANLQARELETTGEHTAELQAQLKTLDSDLKALKRKLTNVSGAIAEAGHSQTLLDQLSDLERQETKTLAEIARVKSALNAVPDQPEPHTIDQLAANLRTALTTGDLDQRRRVLHGLIHSITVERLGDKITGLITYYKPDELVNTEGGYVYEVSHRRESRHTHPFSIKHRAIRDAQPTA